MISNIHQNQSFYPINIDFSYGKKITSIVLAAGKGTRMNSSLSKPLHSVAGKPMLSHIIDNIREAKLNDIIVVISKDNDDIQNYLGN